MGRLTIQDEACRKRVRELSTEATRADVAHCLMRTAQDVSYEEGEKVERLARKLAARIADRSSTQTELRTLVKGIKRGTEAAIQWRSIERSYRKYRDELRRWDRR